MKYEHLKPGREMDAIVETIVFKGAFAYVQKQDSEGKWVDTNEVHFLCPHYSNDYADHAGEIVRTLGLAIIPQSDDGSNWRWLVIKPTSISYDGIHVTVTPRNAECCFSSESLAYAICMVALEYMAQQP